jgi:hypothetical protein
MVRERMRDRMAAAERSRIAAAIRPQREHRRPSIIAAMQAMRARRRAARAAASA